MNSTNTKLGKTLERLNESYKLKKEAEKQKNNRELWKHLLEESERVRQQVRL